MTTEAEYHQFITLVKEMRHAQKKYFETRSKPWLDNAKKAEKFVDMHLKSIGKVDLIIPPQQKLF